MPQIGDLMSKKLYKIGEMADLFDISTDIIRHYDKLGILKPSIIKENGYRYYTIDQLLELEMILTFRSMDLSLDDIASMMNGTEESPSDIRTILLRQSEELTRKIEDMNIRLKNTYKYMKCVDPVDEEINTWKIGVRPNIYHLKKLHSFTETLNISNLKKSVSSNKRNWIKALKFFVKSPSETLYSNDHDDEIGLFTYGSYEFLSSEIATCLPETPALHCIYRGPEMDYFKSYSAATEMIGHNNLQISESIYSLDTFSWKDNGVNYIYTDIYIDLIE